MPRTWAQSRVDLCANKPVSRVLAESSGERTAPPPIEQAHWRAPQKLVELCTGVNRTIPSSRPYRRRTTRSSSSPSAAASAAPRSDRRSPPPESVASASVAPRLTSPIAGASSSAPVDRAAATSAALTDAAEEFTARAMASTDGATPPVWKPTSEIGYCERLSSRTSKPSSRHSNGDNLASMAWGA